jgi:23S rRNA (uridine2479-2'-O)-methyltransferase
MNKRAGSPGILPISKRDNQFQRLEVLRHNRQKRGRYSEFLVEGFMCLERLIRFDWRIRAWVYSSKRGLSERARNLIASTHGVQQLDLAPQLLAELSEKELSSELLAVVEIPPDSANRIRKSSQSLYVVFDRPQNPGNLGTNIRTCDTLGVDTAFIIGHSVDLYDPETVRASVGSIFALPVLRRSAWEVVQADLLGDPTAPLQVIGTSARGRIPIHEADFTKPTVLLIGNEKVGLSAGLLEASDLLVTIPQLGSTTSLNVSCATAILLYEVQRQRKFTRDDGGIGFRRGHSAGEEDFY